jgi:ABC-type Mn2+/Zn2+ transport system ATPase subunit
MHDKPVFTDKGMMKADEPANGSDIYIKAENLNVGYNRESIVSDINFELKKGEAIALIGTNGSGKSTLLKTIVNLIPSLSGRLSVFGMPAGKNPRRIAYLGQFHSSGFILPLRVVDIVRMGRFPLYGLMQPMQQDDGIIALAMRRMGIENLATLPLGSLSGGQQQRTYLAQVLAHQADLLVLDEPTTGIDAGGKELYLQAIKDEISSGASVILATHDIHKEATLCNNVILYGTSRGGNRNSRRCDHEGYTTGNIWYRYQRK